MTSFNRTLLDWTDARLDALLARPEMWGSAEAIEMQTLQLLELRTFALRPEQSNAQPRAFLDGYVGFLTDRFPGRSPAPLCELVGKEHSLVNELIRFRSEVTARFAAEDPFQHSDLAVRLESSSTSPISAMSVTSYSDEVRRATRAFARPQGKEFGRVRKGIEEITDFVLQDVRIAAPNGKPGEAWLLYGRGTLPQQDIFAEKEVRRALATLGTTAQWLDSDSPVAELSIDDPDMQVRAAVQTMRLLPSRDITVVQIGGELCGGSRPTALRAVHAARCVQIIASRSSAEPFDETKEIRGIDLDRGYIVLGLKPRVTCYIEPFRLGTEIREVGVHARVRGIKYKPPLGQPFVLAETIEIEESSGVAADQ